MLRRVLISDVISAVMISRARSRVLLGWIVYMNVAVRAGRVSQGVFTRHVSQTVVELWSVVTGVPSPVRTSVHRALDPVRTGQLIPR